MTYPVAERYYARWAKTTFHSRRIYVACGLGVALCSLITWLAVALLTEQAFNYRVAFYMVAFFAPGTCLMVFAIRAGAVGASWTIANQAKELCRQGKHDKARQLLMMRYRGVHPIVVNHPDFQALLSEVGLLDEKSSGDIDSKYLSIQARAQYAVAAFIAGLMLLIIVTLLRAIFS